MRRLLFVPALLAPLLGACADEDTSEGDPATWSLEAPQDINESTTRLSVEVAAMGCRSGEAPKQVVYVVAYETDSVTLSFHVLPAIDSGTCQYVAPVPVSVTLEEPIGQRSLVDGQCLDGGEAAELGVSECDTATRWSPSTAAPPPS